MEDMATLLGPRQLGYGIPRGAKSAIHAARHYLHNLKPNHCFLKLDFKNAFNAIRRDKMLQAVEALVPDLLPFVHSVYSAPSSLFWEGHMLISAKGVQQGDDPLGPLLCHYTSDVHSIEI